MRVLIGPRHEWFEHQISRETTVLIRAAYRLDPEPTEAPFIEQVGSGITSLAERAFDAIDGRIARALGVAVAATGALLFIFNVIRCIAHGS